MKRMIAVSVYAMLVGAACADAEHRAENLLSAGDGIWTATTFTTEFRADDADGYGAHVVEDIDWSGQVEFFFSAEEGYTAGSSGTFYNSGTITLPDGWIVDIDWEIDAPALSDDISFWMLVYEDWGLPAGDYTNDPRYFEADRVGFQFGGDDGRHNYELELGLEK